MPKPAQAEAKGVWLVREPKERVEAGRVCEVLAAGPYHRRKLDLLGFLVIAELHERPGGRS